MFDPVSKTTAPWDQVAAVEREIRFVAYTSAGDPSRIEDMKMFAKWAGLLQRAMKEAGRDVAI